MLEIKDGIIGFFDILGYQNIIDNNDIEDVVKIVSETIDKLPSDAKAKISVIFKSDKTSTPIIEGVLKTTKTLLISDSIVIALPFPIPKEEERNASLEKFIHLICWTTFFIYAATFMKRAFEVGLPMRGAIDTGQYFIQDYKLAGKPIIYSYRLAEDLQFSGCALAEKATECIDNLVAIADAKEKELIRRWVFRYLAPLKGREERLYLLDWLVGRHNIRDVRQATSTAFRAHNKDVSRAEYPKIENTEMTIRHMLARRKEKPQLRPDGSPAFNLT